jgi:uncharacterized protein YjiS (DUF1127 family)
MLKEIWKIAVAAQERRVNYWKLKNMTDRELQDIGMHRFDIK